MSNLKFKLNRSGVRKLMRSEEMKKALASQAYRAKHHLGDGYAVSTRTGKNRANAEISAVTQEARKDNLKNNTILKAVSSLD